MDKFNFDKLVKNMERVKRELPVILANEAKDSFLDNFSKQGFNGKPWAAPKRLGKKGSQRNNSATLVQSGRLRRSVANSIKEVTADKIKLSIDADEVPYAGVHNSGLRAGRGKGFIMPQRKFMGHSTELDRRLRDKIALYIDKVWQG